MPKLNADGRVTIPARIRTALHLRAGDDVEFVAMQGGEFVMVAASKLLQRSRQHSPNSDQSISQFALLKPGISASRSGR
jgi:antitoxin PrlF